MTRDGQRWSNADEDRVALIEYDPRWPALFEAEAEQIRSALAGIVDATLDHFGSTAVPGLAAKPIIDIMVTGGDQSQWPKLIEPITGLGYVFWADNPRRDRMFFVKGMPPFGKRRTHHVHVRTPADAQAAFLFRDYLRAHPEDAARYAALKRELAEQYSTDRDGYTDGKASFVDAILARATASPAAP